MGVFGLGADEHDGALDAYGDFKDTLKNHRSMQCRQRALEKTIDHMVYEEGPQGLGEDEEQEKHAVLGLVIIYKKKFPRDRIPVHLLKLAQQFGKDLMTSKCWRNNWKNWSAKLKRLKMDMIFLFGKPMKFTKAKKGSQKKKAR